MKLRIHLFEWPSRHNVHLALPLMLVLSFPLHAASIFIFHATFPRSNGSTERVRFHYLPLARLAGSGQDRADAGRLGSGIVLFREDFGPNVWNLPKTAYVASFDEETPELKPLPPPAPSEFLPPDPGTAPITVATVVPKATPVPQPAPATTVEFGGGLEKRAWTPPEGFKFSDVRALTQQGLAPAEFLVAVSPDGLPLHFFPQRSSGNENLDRAALRYLAGCRFAPAPSGSDPAWGTATFVWGGDIAGRIASHDPRRSCRTGLIYVLVFLAAILAVWIAYEMVRRVRENRSRRSTASLQRSVRWSSRIAPLRFSHAVRVVAASMNETN